MFYSDSESASKLTADLGSEAPLAAALKPGITSRLTALLMWMALQVAHSGVGDPAIFLANPGEGATGREQGQEENQTPARPIELPDPAATGLRRRGKGGGWGGGRGGGGGRKQRAGATVTTDSAVGTQH